MRETIWLLKPILAAQNREELDIFIEETTADLHLWYAYLDVVEGRHKESHSKPVRFGSEKFGTVTDLKAEQSSSALKFTMMMAKLGSGSPSDLTETSQEPQSPADYSSTVVAGTSHDSSTAHL